MLPRLYLSFIPVALLTACAQQSSERELGRAGPATITPSATGEADILAGTGPDPELPPPDTSRSFTRFSKVIGWPSGGTPKAPPGFTVNLYADELLRPRWLYVLPNGDLLVAESANPGTRRDTLTPVEDLAARWASGNRGHTANRITLLRDADGDGRAERRYLLLSGLNQPVGMALLGDWLYVANTDELVRYPYRLGDTTIIVPPRHILDLPAGGYNNHWTRNVVASPDGTKLYVSVGSATNVDTEGIDAEDARRAAILELNPDGSGMRVYAGGLRNPVGMDWMDTTLWTVVNERDGLGDNLVPDYLTSVRDGGFYGWPYSYFGRHPDPRQPGKRPDLVARAIKPDFALGAHTASLGLAFYRADRFPQQYRNGAFISQRGSWNRSELAGYRVLFVPFEGGRPAGPAREFLSGFIANRESAEVYGRPLGIAVQRDGSLLVSDDPANRIWRVSYGEERVGRQESGVRRVATIEGFLRPESMRYDPDQDVWFVSNVNGGPERDNNGFISRVSGEGTLENRRFIAGGERGVTLHGPKGMVTVGDTLWVTDLDAVRGFHRRTGAPIATIDLAPLGALFVNDITAGPDGALYLTDTGVRFDSAGQRQHPGPDRIFRIVGRKASVALESSSLGQPNGITYDAKRRRFLLAPIVGDSAVQEWSPEMVQPRALATGPGRYDGIEVTPSGEVLVSAWNDSTVNVVRDGRLVPLIRGVPAAADIGFDPKRRRIGVPLIQDGRVEIWQLGIAAPGPR